jgi:hypothetical protein
MKIRQIGVELFHADGRTDMTKLIVAFRNFANAPKNLKTNHSQGVHCNLPSTPIKTSFPREQLRTTTLAKKRQYFEVLVPRCRSRTNDRCNYLHLAPSVVTVR